MCMWLAPVSFVRNDASTAVSRSMWPCAMRLTYRVVVARALVTLLIAALAGCGGGENGSAPAGGGEFDGERAYEDVRKQVELGPRPAGSAANRRLTRMLAAELRAAGVEGVRVQRPERNVVGTIPGRGEGFVVVGAHHDTKDAIPGFLGANDGASGVAVVLELARTLPRPLPGPGVAVALFDAEEARGERPFSEDGARGSGQYVRYARAGGRQGVPPLGRIEAMVLFDMVGDCDLRIPREAFSDEGLYRLFAEAAGGAPFEGTAAAVADDHVPFIEAGIPAVDLIDFTFGPGGTPGDYWHTTEDDLDKVCPESLEAVGAAALEAIPRIR
jgi:glutaminyl-peptide cyclotransferase